MMLVRRQINSFTTYCKQLASLFPRTFSNMSEEVVQNDTDGDERTPEITMPLVQKVQVPFHDSYANIGYVDVGPKEGPVCLALHGAPGSIRDTLELAEPLINADIRLLIPEFPGYGNTSVEDDNVFDHSTEARTELIKNFLAAVGVSRVCAVVGHSMGIATALNLAANTDICQSFVYLSGIGLEPHKTLKPYWFIRLAAYVLSNKCTGPIFSCFLTVGYQARGFNTTNTRRASLKVGLMSAANIHYDQVIHNAARLRDGRLPMLFAMTQNDRLVEWPISLNTALHCGVSQNNVTWFNGSEEITQGPAIDDQSVGYPRALVFERGGHFVHRSHRDLVCSAVVSFVKFVMNRSSNDVSML